jgi:ssDNA-binding Zn-finger/Zn-ribbon topoisomerase 1
MTTYYNYLNVTSHNSLLIINKDCVHHPIKIINHTIMSTITETKKFVCPRCGTGMNLKTNLISHLQNVKPCEPKVSQITQTDALELFKKKETKLKQVKCINCDKMITKQNIKRHNEVCKKTVNVSEAVASIGQSPDKEMLKAFIFNCIDEAMQKYNTNTSTQNIVNNNIMHITINAFGNEDLSHLTNEMLSYCIMNPSKGFSKLIDSIYYSDEMPLNRNIRYKSTKNNTFEVFLDNQWIECDASNTLDELIRKGYRVLNSHYIANHLNDETLDDPIMRVAIEKFRFLADKTSVEYCAVKRDLRLLIKNRTLYVVVPPQHSTTTLGMDVQPSIQTNDAVDNEDVAIL